MSVGEPSHGDRGDRGDFDSIDYAAKGRRFRTLVTGVCAPEGRQAGAL